MVEQTHHEGQVENKEEQHQDESVEQTAAQEELTTCQNELATWKEQCVRVTADFENYKRRMSKEQAQWTFISQKSIMLDLVNTLDDFERALEQHENQEDALYKALEMMHKSLVKLLEKHDVKSFASYDQFDPELHEAIAHVPSPDKESGDIVDVVSKGYMIKDKVLRYAKVAVAQ